MKERAGRPYTRGDFFSAVGSIDNSIPIEGRSAGEYLDLLKINRDDLDGKRVLDLGAGNNLNFVRQLSAGGIHADVISFSPAFFQGKTWDEGIQGAEEAGRRAVAGMAEELPFAAHSFDVIVAFYLTMYIQTDKGIADTLNEIVRVIRPGGVRYSGPVSAAQAGMMRGGVDTNKKWLNKESIIQILSDKAGVTWERIGRPQREAYTIRVVKNSE